MAGYIIWFKVSLSPSVCVSTCSSQPEWYYESVKQDLRSVHGVKHVHSVHIWSLTMSKTAIAAHLALGKDPSLLSLPPSLPPSLTEPGSISQDVLNNAFVEEGAPGANTTLQVEQINMEDCWQRRSIQLLLCINVIICHQAIFQKWNIETRFCPVGLSTFRG